MDPKTVKNLVGPPDNRGLTVTITRADSGFSSQEASASASTDLGQKGGGGRPQGSKTKVVKLDEMYGFEVTVQEADGFKFR